MIHKVVRFIEYVLTFLALKEAYKRSRKKPIDKKDEEES